MEVVTPVEKLGDCRLAWMCCSISAGRWEMDWFSVSVTAVGSAWFAGGRLSIPTCRVRAAILCMQAEKKLAFCCIGEGTGCYGPN